MSQSKEDFRNTVTWDGISRLHKLVNHLSAAATQIEDLGPNIIDIGIISEMLENKHGISIWKLRDVCDEMIKIKKIVEDKATRFDKYLRGE